MSESKSELLLSWNQTGCTLGITNSQKEKVHQFAIFDVPLFFTLTATVYLQEVVQTCNNEKEAKICKKNKQFTLD